MNAGLYYRVSTVDQTPGAARAELRQAATNRLWPVVLEVEETASGMLNDRPGLLQVMGAARKRQMDVLIVWKFDHFGRSAGDILANVHTLRNHGVQLLCSSQGLLINDRPDPMTTCMLQVMAAFAELEREVIRERTRLGMDAAKKRGVHCGRPQVEIPDPIQVLDLQGEGLGIRRIATRLKSSPWAVRQALNWLKRGTPLELGGATTGACSG